MNTLCCRSTVLLACSNGTNMGLFIPNQGHSPHDGKLWKYGWQHILLMNHAYLLPYQLEGLWQSHYPQDLFSLLLARSQLSELRVSFSRALSLSAHSTLQLSSEVQSNQLGILQLSEQYCLDHPCSRVFLLASIQCRSI